MTLTAERVPTPGALLRVGEQPPGGGQVPDEEAARRRRARWIDGIGAAIAGLWPVAITLAVLRNPGRYNPFSLYSGLGTVPFHSLHTLPTTDPNVYATAYTLGTRAASMLVHGHLPWWNPYEGLGAPLAGELQSGALFPATPLLLLHDGSLLFHLVLELVAGIATYWLLRTFRCNPLVATIGGMLYATNGTFAWLANAAFNPVCFIPIMLLGVERARRAAASDGAGGWRWLAVGTTFALLAGFIETSALALVFVTVIAVQRAWTLDRRRILAFARKFVAGAAAGIAIASPLLVAFRDYLSVGYVYEHAGNAASGALSGSYVAMSISPYLFGRIFENSYPQIHLLWGGVGGYAGFALMALAIASLFGRRDRGLRIVLAAWVGVSLADAVGMPGVRQVLGALPVINHIVLYRYLPPTWELALVLLAALALRDAANATRTQSVVAITSGVLATCTILLVGLALGRGSLQATRATTTTSYDRSVLLVLVVIGALVLASVAPRRARTILLGAVAVCEAGLLFAIPLLSWPAANPVDTKVASFLAANVGTARFFSLGAPSANFGTQVSVRQLNVVDLPVPKANVPIYRQLDPSQNPTVFSGTHSSAPGSGIDLQQFFKSLVLYEQLGVEYVVAPTKLHLFAGRPVATLAYHDARFEIWQLTHYRPLVRVPGCRVAATTLDTYVVHCQHRSTLRRNELYFAGWSATVNGATVAVRDAGRFQAVPVPKGRSVVALTYLPPGVGLSGLASLLGILALLVPWGLVARWQRRRRARAATFAGLEELGSSLKGRGQRADGVAGPDVDPPTGAVVLGAPGALDAEPEDPATSVVPVVTSDLGSDDADGPPTTTVVLDAAHDDGPPTRAVSIETGRTDDGDPPTMAVPRSGPDPRPRS